MIAPQLIACLAFAATTIAGGDAAHEVNTGAADATLVRLDALVRDHFHSPVPLDQTGWDTAVTHAQTTLADADSDELRENVLSELVAGLRTSHTEYLPRSDPRYWDLAAIFAPVIGGSGNHCPDPSTRPPLPVRIDSIGVWWLRSGDSWFVGGVLDDGSAAAAGLKLGDELVSADGARFDPLKAFADRNGEPVRLGVRRDRDGPVQHIDVMVRRQAPVDAYVAATEASARVIQTGGRQIGYLRLWTGVGDTLRERLGDAIRRLNGQSVDGFVLDLRDGWGGVPPEFVSIFDTRVPVLVTRTRAGDEHRFDGQIRVPAAVLINGGTRSGKEVLARAISHHGLATLVGERTAGAMRPGTVFCLPDRALLYLAVGTTTVDGDEFEGIGLDPDVPVPYDPRYAAGADPQLEAAIRILLKRVQP